MTRRTTRQASTNRRAVWPAWLTAVAALAVLLLTLGGCDKIFGNDEEEPARTPGGLGEECGNDNQCRQGLSCIQRNCLPGGDTTEGDLCTLTAECAEDLYCQAAPLPTGEMGGICASAGSSSLDGSCSTDADCEKGLRCELFGFSGTCSATGERDLNADCTASSECMAGLVCGPTSGVCEQSLFPDGAVIFEGAQCSEDTTEGGFGALFEVPRSGQEVAEFYSLPFPNDIRTDSAGRIDLDGHPRPELDVVGNIVKTVIELIEEDTRGFSPHQAVYFRFNTFPQSDSLRVSGDERTIYLVNIDDPEAEDFGWQLSLSFSAQSNQGQFICRNWLAVRPPWNQPFEPGRTYAAYITTGVRGPNDEPPVQSDDLVAVLGDSEPSDSDLATAWDAYARFRTFLDSEQGLAATDIASAAVFTIGEPANRMPALREAVEAADAPEVGDLVLCDDGVTSPCDDGLEGEEHVRGCFAASDDFHEIHTRIDVPIYQEGDAPYLIEGGSVLFDDSGAPIEQRTESVCAAITVPKDATMPEGGWPVVVYAHGTSGSLRSHIASYASDLSGLGYVTIGFDGVQHGERRGDSDLDPDALFFNYVNPRGVAGSITQGAVDVMVVGRYAAALDIAAGDSPTGDAIQANPGLVTFFGHSQGVIVGAPALGVDDVYAAAVLSGGGGGLLLSLLNKTSPVDIAGGIEAVMGDGDLTDTHPLLNLIQLYFEPVDALNYGRSMIRDRPEEMAPPHVLVTWGAGDTYTPNRTTQELVHRLGIPVMTPVIETFDRPEITPPVTGNLFVGTFDVTTALGQYTPPDGRDGHFVAFDVEAARTQILGFLETLVSDGIPTIPAP